MLKKRILSFLGAAALTAALTFAVVSLSPSNGFTSGSMQEGMSYEVCGVSPDAIVASLDGNGASADLITYWIGYNASYLNSYMQYYGGGALDWDYVMSDGTAMPDYIKQDVLATVKQELLIENLAKKYGVTLTDEQRAAIESEEQSFIEQYGSEEAFEEELAKLGLRRETYERITSANYLYQNLYKLYLTEGSALYASNEDLAAYAAAQGYITADHILLTTVDTATGEALSDETVAEKREMLLGGHVAVWDVIARCEITGSSDSSIRNVTANDLGGILKAAPIGTIFCNGATALRLYRKYQEARTGMTAVGLPSTSPANAGWSLERLCTAWGVVGEALEKGTNFDRQGDNFD